MECSLCADGCALDASHLLDCAHLVCGLCVHDLRPPVSASGGRTFCRLCVEYVSSTPLGPRDDAPQEPAKGTAAPPPEQTEPSRAEAEAQRTDLLARIESDTVAAGRTLARVREMEAYVAAQTPEMLREVDEAYATMPEGAMTGEAAARRAAFKKEIEEHMRALLKALRTQREDLDAALDTLARQTRTLETMPPHMLAPWIAAQAFAHRVRALQETVPCVSHLPYLCCARPLSAEAERFALLGWTAVWPERLALNAPRKIAPFVTDLADCFDGAQIVGQTRDGLFVLDSGPSDDKTPNRGFVFFLNAEGTVSRVLELPTRSGMYNSRSHVVLDAQDRLWYKVSALLVVVDLQNGFVAEEHFGGSIRRIACMANGTVVTWDCSDIATNYLVRADAPPQPKAAGSWRHRVWTCGFAQSSIRLFLANKDVLADADDARHAECLRSFGICPDSTAKLATGALTAVARWTVALPKCVRGESLQRLNERTVFINGNTSVDADTGAHVGLWSVGREKLDGFRIAIDNRTARAIARCKVCRVPNARLAQMLAQGAEIRESDWESTDARIYAEGVRCALFTTIPMRSNLLIACVQPADGAFVQRRRFGDDKRVRFLPHGRVLLCHCDMFVVASFE